MFKKVVSFVILTIALSSVQAATAKIYFVSPKNNETVTKNFKVKFAQKGLKVKPAGEDMENKTAGHFHVIVDGTFIPEGIVIPADDKHIHYGKAQMETELTLTPGQHTLTLQFADGAHRSSGEKLSQTITVNVR
ncbi:MAG: DUF4399 domain-containing protein [Bdellovibrionaceae bacterium]|nr:DUF4399 domain-containing protein [Pseudobdellovibrionaceae bacterium]